MGVSPGRFVADRQDRAHLTVRSNPHAERFVLSIKSECIDRLILFNERQLRRACTQFAAHYHRERNHQGLGNRLIDDAASATNDDGRVVCNERLGGLLKYYNRRAA